MTESVKVALIMSAPAWAALFASLRNGRKIDRGASKVDSIQRDVKTMNAQSIGQLADAGESRRIEQIPVNERTATEVGHLEAVDGSGMSRESDKKTL